MRYYHPDIQPYHSDHLPVGEGHKIWFAESGNRDGIPVVILHGGPGAGSADKDRGFFDPRQYRIIQLDQRGCGRSTPHGALENNTPQHLVADLEALRAHLGITQWVLFGGSWGSTLALLYGQTHPSVVLGFILRGIFLGRPEDLSWLYENGAGRIFPEHWQKFCAAVDHETPLLDTYYHRLTGADELEALRVAKAWAAWEGLIATLKPSPKTVARFINPHTALSMARISAHYFVQQCFLDDNQLLRDMPKITDLPAIIVHGRYDMICPMDNAWALKQAWPGARLEVIREAGHSAHDPAMADALIRATDDMAHDLGVPDRSA